jgi:hypothetical protein
MTNRRRRVLLIAAASVALVAAAGAAFAQQKTDKDPTDNPRPRITLRAQPVVGVAPARIVLTAELIGGLNDFEEYYCPTVSWEWGDDTKSESTVDCEPYEAGKSEIKRRFTVQHVFREEGPHKVFFRLKRRNKEVAAAWVNVQVRPGAPHFGPY